MIRLHPEFSTRVICMETAGGFALRQSLAP